MPTIRTIKFNEKLYPEFQASGFAARFAFPFAKEVCKGTGYDIGCNKKEWAFPGAVAVDITLNNGCDAFNLPNAPVDYIFSSHCLEHLPNWIEALDYWTTKLVIGGVIFLYLPHRSQEYWLPFNNRKHLHYFDETILKQYFDTSKQFTNVFISGVDLNNSFSVMGERI